MSVEIGHTIEYCFFKGADEKESYPPFDETIEDRYLLFRIKRTVHGIMLSHELMCALTGTQSNNIIRVRAKKDELLVGEWSK